MKITGKLLSEKKWAFILIFFILLFNPVFCFWADNINLKDRLMAWLTCLIVGLALSCIDLFVKKRGEKIYLAILFILSIVPNLIVWSYLFMSHLWMKRDMFWVIFGTNVSESTEYFDQFISWQMILVGVLYILAGIFFIIKARSVHSISVKKYWILFALSVSLVLLSIILQYLVQAIPTFDFYKSRITFWNENLKFEQEKELRKNLSMDIECVLPDSTGHVFVVVIGESTSTYHMSLYGYFRDTNPLLSARKNELDVYTDVVTPDTHTIGVLKKVLSFADHDHPEYYAQKPSVVEMFNAAGFETYWISNQEFISKWGGSYGAIAESAKHVYDLSVLKKYDEVVLPSLDKVLHENAPGNKIIFIHLMGSHHSYNCRYPDNFDYFKYAKMEDLTKSFLNDEMKKTIDEYDNSVRYDDFVVSSIIDQVKNLDTSSFVLYFSDHGEEVYDSRDARGHFMSNAYPYQCKVPFILWRSDAYKTEMPELAIDTARPFSLVDVIYSLSTLACLEYRENDQSRSIFSPEYKVPAKRLVGDEDYEDILRK